jgi:pimeloyl-ACP methyl ester carboxylesterase
MIPTKLNHMLLKNNNQSLTIFLHGFLGNLRNLKPIGQNKKFKNLSDSLFLDLTNHGNSYHKTPFEFCDMSDDVYETLLDLDIFSTYNKGNWR